jgi:chromate transporter
VKRTHPGSVAEVFVAFLRLGVTSFGGPIAHLGYFREALVVRRKWLSDAAYAELVALCQFLPGPTSSQVGMAIGLQRAGMLGLLAAWVGFTMPSAILLVALAIAGPAIMSAIGTGWIAGLMAAAVAVVALAVIGMARTLTPDARRATIATIALIGVLLLPSPVTQVAAIVVAGAIGILWLRDRPEADDQPLRIPVPRGVAIGCLVAFGVLLVGMPLLAAMNQDPTIHLVDIFTRAGSLVFGGGHVVLPLLESEMVPQLVSSEAFLAGYGAAQAVPGPLFTFAGYLGAIAQPGPGGVLGGAVALVAIFLPGALLVIGAIPFWARLRGNPIARRALAGVGAGVVGILGAALIDPVIIDGLTSIPSVALAITAFVALRCWRAPAWSVVLACALLGWLAL